MQRAGDLVRAHVADPQAQSGTVDRFLDELSSMAPAAFTPEVSADLRSASRDAQSALVEKFDAVSAGCPVQRCRLCRTNWFRSSLLVSEAILARHPAEATAEAAAKKQLLARLLSGKVSATTLICSTAQCRFAGSATSDFVGSLAHVAVLSLLVGAERDNQADEVEDQLFRFSRVLDTQPQLITLLSDYTTPAAGRVGLLHNVLNQTTGANPKAVALLTQTVELLHGERADEAVVRLAQLAVARRGEIVAHVNAAAEPSAAQRTQLAEVLTRIYNHPVSVQLNIDPTLLGGLSVAVGDEVIDGTLASPVCRGQEQASRLVINPRNYPHEPQQQQEDENPWQS